MSNFKNRGDLINLSLDIVFLTYLSTQNYINLDLYNQLLLSKIKKKTNQNKIKFAITNLIINLQQWKRNKHDRQQTSGNPLGISLES